MRVGVVEGQDLDLARGVSTSCAQHFEHAPVDGMILDQFDKALVGHREN